MMFGQTARTTFPSNGNNTEDLDDTLPVELLDCVDTTTNNDWLTRDTPFPGKQSCAPTSRISEQGGSSLFNPPLSSTRYRSDGPSSEFSDISTTAECGSACDDKVRSAASKDSSPISAASMEFQPLLCSTAVTTDVVHVDTFKIRVDTNELMSPREKSEIKVNSQRCSTRLVKGVDAVKPKVVERNERIEFNSLRCSTGHVNENVAVEPKTVQRNESIEFNPLRCSTGLVNENVAVEPKAVQRNKRIEFNRLSCSAELTENVAEKPQAVQRHESIEFNPLRCSTGITTGEPDVKSVKISPASPDEFFVTASSTFTCNTVRESDTAPFVTALCTTPTNSCSGRRSEGSVESPAVQVSESQISAPPKKDDVDNDLSILMQCHLKIRNGQNIVSNLHAKPEIQLSLFKDSAIGSGTAGIPKGSVEDDKQRQQTDRLNGKHTDTAGWVRLKLNDDDSKFPPPSALPTVTKLREPTDCLREKTNSGKAKNNLDVRGSPEKAKNNLDVRRSPEISRGNCFERAMDYLASANIQKVISALSTLDSARSALMCEALVQRGLVRHVYDFLSKMNRSIAHQVACVHATSLLLDLAKYTYSRDSVWQNGERIGILFNLMLIWASKDNAIFLNATTILWVFCHDETRASILRMFVASQNKILKKISGKLGTKISRPASQVPTLQPSWIESEAHRTYQSPHSAFSELSTLLKLPARAK